MRRDGLTPDPAFGPRFEPLPAARTAGGTARRVGVEIEFMGIGVAEAARALAIGLGGLPLEEDPHAFTVRGTGIGDLAVELDLRHTHPQRHAGALRLRPGPAGAAWLGRIAGGIVPRELITAPLPPDRLPEVDEVVAVLRDAGATGNGAIRFGSPGFGSPQFGSLGLHFNIDVPGLEVGCLLAHLRAFMLLDRWLRTPQPGPRGVLSGTRAATPPPYPEEYVLRVLHPDYAPDLDGFIDDYLAANPTRDRGLDLLPLLLHIDPDRVRQRLPREKIGARAVFHYRVPQAHVGVPGWSLAPEWNRWVAVERLAGDPLRVDRLSRAWLLFRGLPVGGDAEDGDDRGDGRGEGGGRDQAVSRSSIRRAGGSPTLTVVPQPSELSMTSRPPWAFTRWAVSGSPSPVPLWRRLRALSIWPKGSSALATPSGDMPMPLSSTRISAPPSA